MPGFDGTGPMGQGPMTGGARGYCNPGYAGYGSAYGRGYGAGRGRGFRRGYGAGFGRGRGYVPRGAYGRWAGPAYGPYNTAPYAMSRDEEINMLKNDAEMIKADLDAINKRMAELESDSAQ